ncbi:flagellar hook-associated protein flid [hydrocarbon metagenome]|uniref:Filament cap protein n=1 Tax=hydrocarbon metagenome TaxID=938273 RepID=A0A0W8E0Z4_9ZZZZ
MAIRLSGLASGLDTESIIKDLMKAERTKVDIQYQQKQLLEWRREDYRDINTKLLALRTATWDLKMESSFAGNTVKSANENILTATAAAIAVDGKYSVNVLSLASGVTAASSESLGSASGTGTLAQQFGVSGPITFSLEGKNGSQSFSFNAENDSLSTVIKQINASGVGITATYDSGVDRLFLTTSDTGSDVKIEIISDQNGFLRDTLKMYTGALPAEGSPVNLGTGQDAEIEFNGIGGLTFSSNQFTLNGISFDLNTEGSTTITVSNDIDATVDKMKAFIEAYNSVVELISSKLGEERDRDYAPLTDAQKEEMSEDQIATWETKARSGLLKGDSFLNSIYSKLRSVATGVVGGLSVGNAYTSISKLGISTSSNWKDNGKLYLDEDKLRAALADHPDSVMKLFTGSEGVDGLADQLYDLTSNSMTSLTNKAGSSSSLADSSYMGKELERINDRIDEWEERLEDLEERYWSQFSAMETALQRLNNQSSWLEQQLASFSR